MEPILRIMRTKCSAMHFDEYTQSVPGIAGGTRMCPSDTTGLATAQSRECASVVEDCGRRTGRAGMTRGRGRTEGARGEGEGKEDEGNKGGEDDARAD